MKYIIKLCAVLSLLVSASVIASDINIHIVAGNQLFVELVKPYPYTKCVAGIRGEDEKFSLYSNREISKKFTSVGSGACALENSQVTYEFYKADNNKRDTVEIYCNTVGGWGCFCKHTHNGILKNVTCGGSHVNITGN